MSIQMTVIGALLVCGACNSGQEPVSPKGTTTPPPANSAPNDPKPAETAPLITQDEADAKAAAAIQKENADAELEKLKQELGGG